MGFLGNLGIFGWLILIGVIIFLATTFFNV